MWASRPVALLLMFGAALGGGRPPAHWQITALFPRRGFSEGTVIAHVLRGLFSCVPVGSPLTCCSVLQSTSTLLRSIHTSASSALSRHVGNPGGGLPEVPHYALGTGPAGSPPRELSISLASPVQQKAWPSRLR